jgi:hypothetical protein
MEHMFARIWENMLQRISGPLKFRLFLQPAMALFFAVRNGLSDARQGKPPYFWGLFTHGADRRAMLQNGWKSIGKVFILAIVLDVIFQLIVLRWVYPGEALMVAVILAIVPYLLVRGPVNRIASRMRSHAKETKIGA